MKWIKPLNPQALPEEYDSRADAWQRPDFLTPTPRREPFTLPPVSTWRDGPSVRDLGQSTKDARKGSGMTPAVWTGIPLALMCLGWLLVSKDLFTTAFVTGFSLLSWISAFAVRRATRAAPDDETLLDDPNDKNEILVEVKIIQNLTVTGVDRGVLTIDGGALIFSGHRTNFILGRTDIQNRYVMSVRRAEGMLSARTWWPLTLKHPSLKLIVAFTPLASESADEEVRLKEMEDLMKRYMKGGGRPPATRLYPPLARDLQLGKNLLPWFE